MFIGAAIRPLVPAGEEAVAWRGDGVLLVVRKVAATRDLVSIWCETDGNTSSVLGL